MKTNNIYESKFAALGFTEEKLAEIEQLCSDGDTDRELDEQLEIISDDDLSVREHDIEEKRFLDDTHDTKLSHNLYYLGIQRFLKKHLPKGNQHRVLREEIREAINTFLRNGVAKPTSGSIGADSRMAHNRISQIALTTLREWRTDQLKNEVGYFELIGRFADLNHRLRNVLQNGSTLK